LAGLSEGKLKRYERNILLTGVGVEGQQKLLASKVLNVGMGGLGSPVALYLAAAGVGTLGVIDHDIVGLSNLQRQIIHNFNDVGRPKVQSAAEKINKLNMDLTVNTYNQPLTEISAMKIIPNYHLVIDATDNFATRQIINKACLTLQIPFVYGGVLAMQGQVMTFMPGNGPCFSCLFRRTPPDNAPTTSTVGILGAMAGVIGTLQAAEAIKILLKIGQPLVGQLFAIDLLTMSSDKIDVRRDPSCPVCGKENTN